MRDCLTRARQSSVVLLTTVECTECNLDYPCYPINKVTLWLEGEGRLVWPLLSSRIEFQFHPSDWAAVLHVCA